MFAPMISACLMFAPMSSSRLMFAPIVSPGIEPSGIVFPSQNNNTVPCLLGVLEAMWELKIFSSAPGWP